MSNEDTQRILEEVQALRAEVAQLRSFFPMRDPEGEYRDEFVDEMSAARDDAAVGEFTDSDSFLKQLSA